MANKRVRERVTKEQIEERFYYDESIGRLRYRYAVRGGNPKNPIKKGDIAGFIHKNGYSRIIVKGAYIAEHIAVYILHNGDYDYNSLQIDHINLNRCDNRIENLRLVTPKQNSRNKLVHASGQESGVTYFSKNKKFGVYTYDRINGRSKASYFGLYETQNEAKSVLDFIESGKAVYLFAAVINGRQRIQ